MIGSSHSTRLIGPPTVAERARELLKTSTLVVAVSALSAGLVVLIQRAFGEWGALDSRVIGGCLIFLLVGLLHAVQLASARQWAKAGATGVIIVLLTYIGWRFTLPVLDALGLVQILPITPINT